MDLKNRLTRTPYLVLFILLGVAGIGTAYAGVLPLITLAGDVLITGDTELEGKLLDTNDDAGTSGQVLSTTETGIDWIDNTGSDTLAGLGCTTDQIAKFDGNSWICGKQMIKNNPISTVDNAGNVGWFTSIAIGMDNNPVISYWDVINNDLKVAHCGNASCSAGNNVTTIDGVDKVGQSTSIAIGTDGNPVISYWDVTNFDLKVAHCGNASCSAGNNVITVDNSTDIVGQWSSIAIGTDNNPVISYSDGTNNDLKVIHCGNASCSFNNTITTVDNSTDNVGLYTSIAIGADDNPVISYYDQTNGDLKVAHCGNTSCSAGNVISTADSSSNNVGIITSIAIGIDNNPVISYRDNTNFDLKVTHCGNPSCSAGNVITNIDFFNKIAAASSIAIGPDNNPVISYYEETTGSLKVAHCGNISCTDGNVITVVYTTGDVGQHTSIAIGTDGNPVVSFYDADNDNLKVVVEGIFLIFE